MRFHSLFLLLQKSLRERSQENTVSTGRCRPGAQSIGSCVLLFLRFESNFLRFMIHLLTDPEVKLMFESQ